MEGYLPKDWVGHINSQKDDNRFINIIQTTRKHRQRNRKENENNTSGYTGVYFKKDVKLSSFCELMCPTQSLGR
jgi:hypothetical protein